MSTPAKGETLEEIAERIMWPAVGKVAPAIWNEMVYEILSALRNEREACAKVAEAHEGHGDWCSSAAGDCQTLTVKAIATAIREGR